MDTVRHNGYSIARRGSHSDSGSWNYATYRDLYDTDSNFRDADPGDRLSKSVPDHSNTIAWDGLSQPITIVCKY